MDSSAALNRSSARFSHGSSIALAVYAPAPLSWAFYRLPQSPLSLSNALPLYILPHDVLEIVVSCTHHTPLGSYRIPSLMIFCDNGRPEFTPFFPSASLFFGAVIYYPLSHSP